MVYAHGIGVDYADGEYIFYLQIINLASIAKTESVSTGDGIDPTEIGRASAKNLNDAIYKLYRSSQNQIYWSNLAFLIMTERLLKEVGIKEVIELLNRFPQTRYHINVFSTNDSLEEMLLFSPVLNISSASSKLARPENSLDQSSFLPMRDMRNFIIELNEPGYEVQIPRAFLTKTDWRTSKEPRTMVGFSGVTLYHRDDHYLGSLTGKQTEGFRWVSNHFNRDNLTLRMSEYNQVSLVITKKRTKITPIVNGNDVKFRVKVKAEATINILDKGVRLKELEKKAETAMRKQIVQTYKDALKHNADIYMLSNVLYRKDRKTWSSIQTRGKIPLTEDSIETDIDILIRDSGVLRYYPTVK